MITLSHNQPMPEGNWTEHLISGCPNGCKIYVNENGDKVYAHNSNYGCRR